MSYSQAMRGGMQGEDEMESQISKEELGLKRELEDRPGARAKRSQRRLVTRRLLMI